MKKLNTSRAFFVLILYFYLLTPFTLISQTHDKNFVDGKLYVKLKDSEPAVTSARNYKSVQVSEVAALQSLSMKYQISDVKTPFYLDNDPKLVRTLQIEIKDVEMIDEIIKQLEQDETVEYVEKIPINRIDYIPNDSLYNLYNGPQTWNWHLKLIQAEEAWNITRGSPDIIVAIVDNAVWTDHPDLKGKIKRQRNVYADNNNANPPDTGNRADWSHGTHVAGLIGATSDNIEGISSIGFNVSLMAIKAAGSSADQIEAAYEGVQWAADNGAEIINMSWGSPDYSRTAQNLLNTVSGKGIILVAAAGNDDSSGVHYPSEYDNVISVASTDWNDRKSRFSNYSESVDISAPGGVSSPGPAGLLSTTYRSGIFGNYDTYQGTSMATPIVSGVVGLVLSINPRLTSDEVREVLVTSVDDISAINPDLDGLLGTGRINAFKAVSNTPFLPNAKFNTPVKVVIPGASIDFIDNSEGVPSDFTWTFEGGTPNVSNDKNPENITYESPGVYDVTLRVSNKYGTNTITYSDYIQVVTDPSPYVFISVSDTLPCIGQTVTLEDSSLYGPISWDWLVSPANFSFVDGTTNQSQNPRVEFTKPGDYNITLTVTNINGSTSKLFEHTIQVQGITTPYLLDMEEATSGVFELWDSTKSQSIIDLRAANSSSWGIHFHGDPVPTGWMGTSTGTTPEQAWGNNREFNAEATVCSVNAIDNTDLALSFDLRQTYSFGAKNSWFRVLVNGQPIADVNGNINFNPTTQRSDPWRRIQYNLTPYIGTILSLTLQASNRYSDKVQGEGDNVFIDNIQVTGTNPLAIEEIANNDFTIYPNPSKSGSPIGFIGIKYATYIEILNTQGKIIFEKSVSNSNGAETIKLPSLSPGLYLVRIQTNESQKVGKLIISN